MSTRRALTTDPDGLGPFARRKRPRSSTKKLLIILTSSYFILGVAGNLNLAVDKCCPRGTVMSLSKDLSCSFARDHLRQIYQFQGQAFEDPLAKCSKDKRVTLARLEEVVKPTIRADIACIDVMHNEDTSEPIMFRCALDGPGDDPDGTGSFAVPRVATLRMCCGTYQVYDVEKRDCVFKKDGPNVPSNFKFLKENFEFATVVRGAPPCESAVLDYVVNATRDLRVHDDGRLELVLATKDGPKTIVANENNTCLDPGTSGTPGLVVVRSCSEEKFCDKNPCVSKCCSEDQAMVNNGCNSIPPGVPAGYFHEMLHNVSVKRGLERGMKALENSDYGMLIGSPCEYEYVVDQDTRWHITPLGNIDVEDDKIYGHDEYCVEMFFGDHFLNDSIYPFVRSEKPES